MNLLLKVTGTEATPLLLKDTGTEATPLLLKVKGNKYKLHRVCGIGLY